MKKEMFISLSLLLSFVVACSLQAKTDCSAGRYEKDVFTWFTKTSVEYASNKGWDGEQISLKMDIYTPNRDSLEKRPLVIFAHGGGYVQGDKADMDFSCQQFVRKGFVTATIQYRLIPYKYISDPQNMMNEIVKAMSDMKAAIRFFRESVAKGNPYKIDADNIFIGGASAGAITALHVGMLDEKDVMPADFKKFVEQEGGLEGNTGSEENKKYPSKVKGVINYSGGLYKDVWVDAGDPPFFSYHGMDDDVVPFEYGIAGKSLPFYGSGSLKKKADEAGVPNLLTQVPKGKHTDIYTNLYFASYFNSFHNDMFARMKSMICTNAKE